MIKYFIIFEKVNVPFKLFGYRFLEKINLNEIIILDYFK